MILVLAAALLEMVLLGGFSAAGNGPPALNVPPGSTAPATCTTEGGCGNYGTSVKFLPTPSEAARRARQEEKLVFVLHVSGHFEDPKFT